MSEEKVLRARDLMKTDVVTLRPDTSVEEAGRVFIEKDISGAPVVSKDGTLYGIVTENDLISKEKRFHIPTIIRIFDAIIPLESDKKVEEEIKKMTATTVGEICTRDVITITEDTDINEIATIMTERRVHLLPVMKEGKIVGIVGKKDLIRGLSGL
ncbi:MAG: CBS domain-containing protein [Nitrospirae bacterium]|nr:MAG: CBS domain-containing protein [Nitrospirota bacterium]